MDFVEIAFRAVPILISAGALAWTIGSARSKAQKEELQRLERRIEGVEAATAEDREDGHKSRAAVQLKLAEIEAKVSQMPDRDTVHSLALAVADIRGDLKAQGETLKAVAASNQRVESFLLRAER